MPTPRQNFKFHLRPASHYCVFWCRTSNINVPHTHTTVLQPSRILSGTNRVSWHQKSKTKKVKPVWIYWSKR